MIRQIKRYAIVATRFTWPGMCLHVNLSEMGEKLEKKVSILVEFIKILFERFSFMLVQVYQLKFILTFKALTFKLPLVENDFSHTVQVNGLAPVCDRI